MIFGGSKSFTKNHSQMEIISKKIISSWKSFTNKTKFWKRQSFRKQNHFRFRVRNHFRLLVRNHFCFLVRNQFGSLEGFATHFPFEQKAYYSLTILAARKCRRFRNTFSFEQKAYYSLTTLAAGKCRRLRNTFSFEQKAHLQHKKTYYRYQ